MADSAEMGLDYADRVVVNKTNRQLYLMKNGDVLKSYEVSFGLNPDGHKEQEGDFRTPEGVYYLNRFNARSQFFLSIQISYPNKNDVRRARRNGVSPGGQIMIHGRPNEPNWSEAHYKKSDWTDGCIAVSNSDMVEIWLMTAVNTPIEIQP